MKRMVEVRCSNFGKDCGGGMREVKFRGKSKLSIEEMDDKGMKHVNGWVYGNLITNNGEPLIVGDLTDWEDEYITHDQWCSVRVESVGQYTVLKDKNGTEIHVGDLVNFNGLYEIRLGEHGVPSVEDEEYVDTANGYYLKAQHDLKDVEPFNFDIPLNERYAKECEIIGNTFDNPELLEVRDEPNRVCVDDFEN